MTWTDLDRRYWKMRFDILEAMMKAVMGVTLATGEREMASIADLDAAVEELTTAVDAAVAAIGSASGIDPADLDHVSANIQAQTARLTQAVADAVEKAHSEGM